MSDSEMAFIEAIGRVAKEHDDRYGIPASVTIAQAILESNWGRSELAIKAKNLFGIKFKQGDKGESYSVNSMEYVASVPVGIVSHFRKYRSWSDSLQDHSDFLMKKRYEKAFETNNSKDFIREVHKAGYATDPEYSNKVIKIMDDYDLYQYDIKREIEDNKDKKEENKLSMKKTICIAAGHGMPINGIIDPGATYGGIKEKDVAADVVKKVVKLFKQSSNFNIIEVDQKLDLPERCDVSNDNKANIYIEVHCNAATNSAAYGIETYYASEYGGKVADYIQKNLIKIGEGKYNRANTDRGIKQTSGLYVLNQTKAAAVLLELGFISNETDRRNMLTEEWKNDMAMAIFIGVCNYYGFPTNTFTDKPTAVLAPIITSKINEMDNNIVEVTVNWKGVKKTQDFKF